jgi:site-specific DNA-methyltransferase (cytosine-N4-specific)
MKAWLNKCHFGDCLETMHRMPDGIVQTCVTSPPYFGLRDYGHDGQIGLESTPEQFIAKLVDVFREVKRVLRDDGTLWLNIGDSYAANRGYQVPSTLMNGCATNAAQAGAGQSMKASDFGVKPKDLIGIPWLLAFALRADGWYLRQEIIWHKPNPMPESVTDRCTKSHESIFLLAKSEKYYFDQASIVEPCSASTHARLSQDVQNQIGSERANGGAKTNGNMKAVGRSSWNGSEFNKGKTAEHQLGRSQKERKFDPGAGNKNNASFDAAMAIMPENRNKRSVWTVATTPYKGAHFATFPTALIEPCILAGAPAGGVVLDPFYGSGTTGQVAQALGRHYIGCELNPAYKDLQDERTCQPSLLLEAS